MLLLPLKKVTTPAPWAAAEPEITGKDLRPQPVLCGSQAADFNTKRNPQALPVVRQCVLHGQ